MKTVAMATERPKSPKLIRALTTIGSEYCDNLVLKLLQCQKMGLMFRMFVLVTLTGLLLFLKKVLAI